MSREDAPAATSPQDLAEAEIRALHAAGDYRATTDRILETYGSALYGYIRTLISDEATAADAFQHFSLRLWQSLASFAWRSALRTWLFTVARNAALRTAAQSRDGRARRLATAEEADLCQQWQRSTTALWQQTAEKSRLWSAIAALPAPDRELLFLRLDQRLSWTEIAALTAADAPDAAQSQRTSAALRKRFERIKERLKAQLEAAPK